MKVFVVTKTMVGLDGTFAFVGAFSDVRTARARCKGAGTFHIAQLEVDDHNNRAVDVEIIRVLGALEI